MKPVVIALMCLLAAAVPVWRPLAADASQIRPAVPVLVGGQEASEGCTGTMVVTVRAGTTLNLRAGPGTDHPAIARLSNGQSVSICQRRNGWVGVLVHRDTRGARDCGVSDAGPRPVAYAGPCQSGWLSERYLRIQAG